MLGIFLDSETNGLYPQKHKVIEIAFIILDMSTKEQLVSYEALVRISREDWGKSDPQSLHINGFCFEDLNDGKDLSVISSEIQSLFKNLPIQRGKAVFICQNPSFDRAFFSQIVDPEIQEKNLWPYHWLDLASMFWSISILKSRHREMPLPWETGYTKDSIAAFYNIPKEKTPHRAMRGVQHLLACYEKVVGFPNDR
jgi:oligoribonuclease